MLRIIASAIPPKEWNIYAAQASDGDNISRDSERCAATARGQLMRLCQYYAYVEIIDERESEIFGSTDNGTSLWRAYRAVDGRMAEFRDDPHRQARPTSIPSFASSSPRQPARGN
jgi:uncharacterized sporulation protein YeaH/YhbH (DUF444 family)